MKLLKRLLFAAAAFGLVLALGLVSQENDAVTEANPMKVSREQYERIHEPGMLVNVNK